MKTIKAGLVAFVFGYKFGYTMGSWYILLIETNYIFFKHQLCT